MDFQVPYYKTISVPVWVGTKDGVEYVYVPSVDIPRGSWVVVMRLTPVDNQILAFEGGYTMVSVNISSPQVEIQVDTTREILDGKGYQLFITNNLPSVTPNGKKQAPVPWTYGIEVQGPNGRHHFDPVVIAQPDPVYP